jgi:hypothetical protein
MRIRQYQPSDALQWNTFLADCKNGHFMFNRNYMDYHQDRFQDHSLMVFDDNDLIALLPANIQDRTLYSHQGLSFGGFIVDHSLRTESMLEIFEQTRLYMLENAISKFVYKCIPHIYHDIPAEEDRYALFRHNAVLVRRDVSSTLNLSNRPGYSRLRTRCVKKALKSGLTVSRSGNPAEFWRILAEVLQIQHNASPVHSLDEIKLLMSRFPDNIKLFTAELSGETLAGCLVFETKRCIHAQYLACTVKGRDLGALDLIIDHLIADVYADSLYFDFGISNEQSGRYLNAGLAAHKESFGARAVVHDFYELNIL